MRLPLHLIGLGLAAVTLAPAASGENAPPFESILKIDAHSHVFEDAPEFPALFRRLQVRTINVCNNGTDEHLGRMHEIAFSLYRQHPMIYPFESTFDLRKRDEPDYDYYAGQGEISYDNRKVDALGLPRAVLEKFYHGNAERLFQLDAAWTGRN